MAPRRGRLRWRGLRLCGSLIRGCCGRGLRESGCLEKGGLRLFGRAGICSAGEIRKNL